MAVLDSAMYILDQFNHLEKTELMQNTDFLSRQVLRAHYYFLDLDSPAATPTTTVLCGGLEECAPSYRMERPHGLLELLLLHLAEQAMRGSSTTATGGRDTYDRCRRYLQQHCLSLTSLAELASHCHVDPAYLCRLFRRFGDRSPYQLLVLLKMRRAAELLAGGGLLVREVARQVGFLDPYHFSKVFKRIHGVAPENFLRTFRRK